MTSITNKWSGIYRILAGREKRPAPQIALKQKDGSLKQISKKLFNT